MLEFKSEPEKQYSFEKPVPLKRQCTDPVAFECTHGVTFRECYP